MALRTEGRAPKLIVIENVVRLITGHGGKDFDALVDALIEGGYRVGAMVIDAALFVPQSRERVFIIGVDASLDIPAEIVADGPTSPFHPPMLVKACSRRTTPIWFKLPVPPPHGLTLRDIIDDQAQEWDARTRSPRSSARWSSRILTGSRKTSARASWWFAASTTAPAMGSRSGNPATT